MEDGALGPFDCWWKLYLAHCPRMDNKQKCKAMFNKFKLETQREIYADTRDRLKYYDDWQAKTPNGKRQFMRAPIVYLRARMWECPVEKPKREGNVRDTTKEAVRPSQELHGLKQMRVMYLKQGLDTGPIDKQIRSLENAH